MTNGIVLGICVAAKAGDPMKELSEVQAIQNFGLEGDRYAAGAGSYNREKAGYRQVTLINNLFVSGSGFRHVETRRNILVEHVELMWLIGREFHIGDAVFLGVKYCDPCERPAKLGRVAASFTRAFIDRGGLIAQVVQSGLIRVGDPVIPPTKGY